MRASGTAGTRVTVWVPQPIARYGSFMASVLDSLGYRAAVKAVVLPPTAGIVAYFDKILDSRVRAQIGYITWQSDYPSAFSFLKEEFGCAAFVPGNPARTAFPSELCDRSLDAEMDHASAVQAVDPAAANLLWQRIEREILSLAPVVPTYNPRVVDFVSERVGNYQYNPQWGVLLDQLWVK